MFPRSKLQISRRVLLSSSSAVLNVGVITREFLCVDLQSSFNSGIWHRCFAGGCIATAEAFRRARQGSNVDQPGESPFLQDIVTGNWQAE